MKTTTIYALIDPVSGHIRYVGKTVQSEKHRLATHISAAKKYAHTRCARWILGLLKSEMRPEVISLETTGEDWQDVESFWIAYLRFLGCDLTNHTAGGEGMVSYQHTDNARENMRAAQQKRYAASASPLKGRARPAEVARKISESQKGREISQEHREKISTALRGRALSEEAKANLSKVMSGRSRPEILGRPQTAEANAKRSAALMGVPKSEEHRRKLSEAARRRYHRDQIEIPQ